MMDKFRCDICDKQYTTYRALCAHQRSHQNQMRKQKCPYTCSQCNLLFVSDDAWLSHFGSQGHKVAGANKRKKLLESGIPSTPSSVEKVQSDYLIFVYSYFVAVFI